MLSVKQIEYDGKVVYVGPDTMTFTLRGDSSSIGAIPSDKLARWLDHNSINADDIRLLFDLKATDPMLGIEFKYDTHAVTFKLTWTEFV